MTANRNNTLHLVEGKGENLELRDWIDGHRTVLNVFLDAYCIVTPTKEIIEFNLAFEELSGESHKKILKANTFSDVLNIEPDPVLEVLSTNKSIRLDEVKGITKNHQELQLIISGIPILNASKKTIGALITIRNVSAESELQKKYDERKRDSITDGLTRLFNKSFTEESLGRMIRVALRDHKPLSVLLCDIDNFKNINDQYGHQAGDYVLSLVAQMLKGESRDTDIVGRFGGEEFIVLLHNTDSQGAKIFAERFRKRLETSVINHSGKQIPVTVSCGTDTFISKWAQEFPVDSAKRDLILHADMALYYSKAKGRNQTWQYEALPSKASKKN